MFKDNFHFSLSLYGEDLTKTVQPARRRISEHHYLKTLQEAFIALLTIDIRQFDFNTISPNVPPYLFSTAEIKSVAEQGTLLDIIGISISDSPDAQPPPGIYLRFEDMDIIEFQHKTGIDLSRFSSYDEGSPFLMLGRFKFDEQFELILDPEVQRMQAQIKQNGGLDANHAPTWNYKLYTRTLHYEDDLTAARLHNGIKNGALPSNDFYYYKDLGNAFMGMLRQDCYTLDPNLAFDRGLGCHLQKVLLTDNKEHSLVELSLVDQIKSPGGGMLNGVYSIFYIDIPQFEKRSGFQLDAFKQNDQYPAYQQLLAYTADRKELIGLDCYHGLFKECNIVSPEDLLSKNRYLLHAPFYLQLEWERSSDSQASSIHFLIPNELRQYMSAEVALQTLLDIDNQLFYREREAILGQSFFITYAGVYDAADAKPIWSKFLSQPNDKNLPNGVFVRLHEEKTTMETIEITLRNISSVAHADGLCFLAYKPDQQAKQPGKDIGEQPPFPGRTVKPPGQTGPSL